MQTATIPLNKSTRNYNVKNQLLKLSTLLAPHQASERNDLIEELILSCSDSKDNDSEKMLGYLIAANLRSRFSGTGIRENIYDTVSGVSQIRLFDILIHQFPFVKYSQEMTNKAIVNLLTKQEEACIIDIGIGLGTQMVHVLDRAVELTNLRKLTIIGIEPFEGALSTAGERIMAYKDSVGFELEFIPVPQYIELANITALPVGAKACIVNASLALHHIKSDVDRTRVIADIKKLQPAGFLLIEPNVNHYTNDLSARLLNSYGHFIALFRVIDRLDASKEDKNGLKMFFGRELEDILSKANDVERFEKHEPVSAWLHRLKKCGFETATTPLAAGKTEVLGVVIQPYEKGYVGFSEQAETVLSVIFAS
jgi:hypothetical protein